MKLTISEVLEQTSKKPENEQVEFIKKHDSQVLRMIIEYALNPNVKWLLPEGKPPFTYANDVETHGMLFSQARLMYLFIQGGNDNLNKMKREQLFIQVLESVHPDDADLLIAIKDKRIPYDINPRVFNEAFGFQFATDAPPVSPGVEIKETGPKTPIKRGRGRPRKVIQENAE